MDDEESVRTFVAEVLEEAGHAVVQAADGAAAAAELGRGSFDLLITDLRMPRMDGMELTRLARARWPDLGVLVLTAHGTVSTAVEAMKLGAIDFLTKPLPGPDELEAAVRGALARRGQRAAPSENSAPPPETTGGLLAAGPAMRAVLEQLRKVAPTDATVLILGESGTGKELVASALHRMSRRSAGPFVALNCAALSESLLESELFGHEKGAFTGATSLRRGRFELAEGGTLFLDELGELRPEVQAKLLRVLQERRFERLGGSRLLEADVRVVAATHRDLEAEVRAGRFREDLFHRLAVFPVHLPPLRARPEEILPLAEHLLAGIAARLGRPRLTLAEGARRRLLGHSWPGNVRELSNALERAAILAEGAELSEAELALGRPASAEAAPSELPLDLPLDVVEREAIRRALAATGGHRKLTAERLGIGLRTLYDKLKLYKLG